MVHRSVLWRLETGQRHRATSSAVATFQLASRSTNSADWSRSIFISRHPLSRSLYPSIIPINCNIHTLLIKTPNRKILMSGERRPCSRFRKTIPSIKYTIKPTLPRKFRTLLHTSTPIFTNCSSENIQGVSFVFRNKSNFRDHVTNQISLFPGRSRGSFVARIHAYTRHASFHPSRATRGSGRDARYARAIGRRCLRELTLHESHSPSQVAGTLSAFCDSSARGRHRGDVGRHPL